MSKKNHFDQLDFENWFKENINLFIEIDCMDCQSSGWNNSEDADCERCGGIGELSVLKNNEEITAVDEYDNQCYKDEKRIDKYNK